MSRSLKKAVQDALLLPRKKQYDKEKQEYHEPQCFHRIDEQQQYRRRDTADERSEKRDQIGQADDNADKQRIIKTEYRHSDKAHQTDDRGIVS